MKVSRGQSQPEMGAAALLTPYMVLGRLVLLEDCVFKGWFPWRMPDEIGGCRLASGPKFRFWQHGHG